MKNVVFTVRGVSFENRQEIIAKLSGDEFIKIIPEPTNAFDANALAVHVAFEGKTYHIGYVPKEHAAEIAPQLDGESVSGQVARITGGFVKPDGELASRGVVVLVELPDAAPADMSAGWEV